MNHPPDPMSHDRRIGYLAGDACVPIDVAERGDLDALRGLLAEPAVWAEPDPALEDRIVTAITERRNALAPHRAVTPSASTPPAVEDLDTRRRSRRIRYAILGAAAAVLLTVGLAFVTASHRSRPSEYAASLAGTTLGTGASGHVTVTETTGGWEIHLHATGLPRLDNGRYYEAWFKSVGGILVPVGTFNQATNVTLWAGVPPSSYPTVTITRQQADGDPDSSGQVVLIGTTHHAH